MPDLTSFQFHPPGSTASAGEGDGHSRSCVVPEDDGSLASSYTPRSSPIIQLSSSPLGLREFAPAGRQTGSDGPGDHHLLKGSGVCFDSKAAVMPLLLTISPYGILV